MQIVVGGIVIGCIYALTALGLVLIYRTTEIVNFAHGEMAMFSTFVSYIFLTRYEMPYYISFLMALLFSAFIGYIIYRLLMRRMYAAPHLNQIVITLGLFMLFNGAAGLIWGYQPEAFPEAIQSADPIEIAGVFITKNEIFIVGITLFLMLGFYLLFRFTKVGLAMRAAAQDVTSSQLMGINVTQVFTMVWVVGAVLGAVAGMLTAPLAFLSPNMMFHILILSFAAAVLGGFISLSGAVLGGLIVGVFENVVGHYVAPDMKIVFVFLLIVIVLYIRPQGILGGAKHVKKV